MPSETSDYFTMRLKLPKTSRQLERGRVYLEKLRVWIDEERKSMPFDKIRFSERLINLRGSNFLFAFHLRKTTEIILGARKPRENLDQLNSISNRIFSFLNTIMLEEVSEVEVATELHLEKKGKANIARKIIGDSRTAKVSEIIKIPWSPFGIMYEWEKDSRNYFAVISSLEPLVMLSMYSRFEWKNNLPMDALTTEKEELLKFEESVDRLLKEDL